MPIARVVAEQLTHASWIRRMFEEGAKLKRERGPENVFDYTLGNPDVEPPAQVLDALKRVAATGAASHGYMPNAGYPAVREMVAAKLHRETGVPFGAEDIVMTVGSAGACNVLLKAILDPGDEVIVLAPYFSEYAFYITNHGGRMIVVETTQDFLPDVAAIEAAITPRTRAIFLNTPNNPTGRVYPESVLRELNALIERTPQPIIVISDEPYKSLVYDGKKQPEVAALIANTAVCTSWSKSQAIAGERIGYLGLSPNLPDVADLRRACIFTNRILGFVNAPAIWQRVMLESAEAQVDVSDYQSRRDLLCRGLRAIGYDVTCPEATYYFFLKTPIADDIEFVKLLAAEGVLTVPGTGFGRSGHIRLSITIPLEQIRRSLSGFERAFRAVQQVVS